MSRLVPPDPWRSLAARTPARIGLGRAGTGLPTREVLDFALGHARARDAVHAPFDAAGTAAAIEALGLGSVLVDSAANDRAAYLRRPDLGRRLAETSETLLRDLKAPAAEVVVIVADGLSGRAARSHAAPLLDALTPPMQDAGLTLAPVVVARRARVALGDQIGGLLGARLTVMLIGERPGLTSPDSLGAYITFAPRPGRTDAERNCVSNIRPAGLPLDEAARRIAWLVREALRLATTGVALKDESALELLISGQNRPILGDGA